MRKIVTISLVCLGLAGCATQPTQSEMELSAYRNVLREQYQKGRISAAEAELASAQYEGALRSRESNIAASNGIAMSNQAYANNSTMALGAAMYCAGQRGGHC